MTLRQVNQQLHSLSVNHHVDSLEDQAPIDTSAKIAGLLLEAGDLIPRQATLTIELPDGWWTITVTEYARGQYDYWIPETREQEQRLLEETQQTQQETQETQQETQETQQETQETQQETQETQQTQETLDYLRTHYGRINYNGSELILVHQAYADGTADDRVYVASAINPADVGDDDLYNVYQITWTVEQYWLDGDQDDEGAACDWDNPADVELSAYGYDIVNARLI